MYIQGPASLASARGEQNSFISLQSEHLDASTTAVLIVDVQPEYWSDCPAVRQDFPNFPQQMKELLETVRAKDAKCIWVRAEYDYEKSPWLQQFARLHKGRIPPIVKASSHWEEFATPLPHEDVLTKSSWSSTSNTDLLNMLRRDGIETVLVCGLITSVCVQHSAFGVFEAGFRTLLVTDCCADRGKARHEAALALYGDYMYELYNAERVRNELRREKTEKAADECSCSTHSLSLSDNDGLSYLSSSPPQF